MTEDTFYLDKYMMPVSSPISESYKGNDSAMDFEGKTDDFSITNSLIKGSAVTNDKVKSVAASKLTGTIDAATINVTNINANNITSGTINAGTIAVLDLSASNISSGTLSANRITGGTLSANYIGGGTVTANILTAGTIIGTQVVLSDLNASNITAGTITGIVFRTAASGARVEIVAGASKLTIYNSAGARYLELDNEQVIFASRSTRSSETNCIYYYKSGGDYGFKTRMESGDWAVTQAAW